MGRFRFGLRTITGQITALVVLSVAVALLISLGSVFALVTSRREKAAAPPLPPFATVFSLAANAKNESEIAAIVKNAARAGVPTEWLHGERARALLSKSRSEESELFGQQPAFMLRILRGPQSEVVLPLYNDDVLVSPNPFATRPPMPPFFAIPAIYAFLIAAVCILGLSLYAAHFITTPLSSFAHLVATIERSSGIRRRIPQGSPVEIVRVAQALDEMQGRIQSLLDERTNMLTAIGHDLRTPLTRMKLRVEKLMIHEDSSAAAKGMLDDIARMEQMLAETISYLRDDGKSEEIVAADMPSILRTICSELSDLGKSISYNGPARFVCYCRPSAISRAISNVVDNALKYGTMASVSLSALPLGLAKIEITDNGPGLCYSHRIRVFEPFFKADQSRTGPREGFGLGLSITKKIIESHGGSVELLEVIPHGLKVQIVMPTRAGNIKTSAETEEGQS